MAGKGGYESGGNGKETGGKGNRGKEITMQSDQLGKMSWRGIHFDLKEGHLEGHLALNVASPAASSAPSGRTIRSFIVLKTMFIHVYHRSK